MVSSLFKPIIIISRYQKTLFCLFYIPCQVAVFLYFKVSYKTSFLVIEKKVAICMGSFYFKNHVMGFYF
jgi:hypothetical protein